MSGFRMTLYRFMKDNSFTHRNYDTNPEGLFEVNRQAVKRLLAVLNVER